MSSHDARPSLGPPRRRAARAGEAGRYRELIENAYEIVSEVDEDGTFLYVNPTSQEITGYPPDEIVGKSVFEHIHPDDRFAVIEIFEQAVSQDRPGHAVYRYRHQDGRWLWLESAGRPYEREDGRRVAVIHTRDVSERVEAEGALREEEARHRALAENVEDIIVELDENGRYVYMSPNFEEACGYDPRRLLGQSPEQLAHPDDWASVEATIDRVLASGEPDRVEYRSRDVQGNWYWIEAVARPFRARTGDWHLAAVCRDVTARKLAEEANASLAMALDRAAEAILVTDAEGCIRFANASFARLLGRPVSSLLGRSVEVLAKAEGGVGDWIAPQLCEARTALEASGEWFGTWESPDAEGRMVYHRAVVTAAHDGDGRITHYIASVRDVSREAELEAELRQAQKLEALGTMAGGIAHDFNNLLTGILGYASLLRSGLRDESEIRDAAEVIEAAALRGAELAKHLLGFAGRAPQPNTRVAVHDVIADVTRLLCRTIPRNVHVRQRLDAPRSAVVGDPGQLQQVLLNLALNARDAMPDGGELTFETELGLDESGPQLVVRVRDTGIGIPKEQLDRIYEPFFTTKGPGRGSGMGLSVVYGIVTGYGGTVSVESNEGKGTVFRLALPIAEDAPPAVRPNPRALVRGTGRVLVVDDEPSVRRVLARMLERLGYSVVSLRDGQEAVDYYRTRGAAIDLVIVDLDMPGMGGEECFHRLRGIDAGARVLISTGLGPAGAVESLLADGACGYLGKPYVVAELSDAVARALADDEDQPAEP